MFSNKKIEDCFDNDVLFDIVSYLDFGLNSIRTKNKREIAEKELAKEKEELSITLSSVHEGVIRLNAEGKIILVNNAALEILYHS